MTAMIFGFNICWLNCLSLICHFSIEQILRWPVFWDLGWMHGAQGRVVCMQEKNAFHKFATFSLNWI